MKYLKLILLTLIIGISSFGCLKRDKYDNININVTSYPIEYITNYLYGDYSKVNMIYPSDVDVNNYELSPKQIKDYAKADMFIYNGLSKEKNIAASLLNKNKNLDIIDISKGLEIENDPTELWLSPTNFLMIASNIKNSLKEYVSNQKIIDKIDDNYDKLKVSISEIDVELKTIAENASNNTLIVGNSTFNFLKNYGFNVIYIDDSENSNTNLSQAKKLVQNKSVSNLFVLSGYTETDNIKELVKAGIKIVEVPNLYTINSEQRNNNQDYLFFIKNMVENIKTEVY